MAVLIAKSQRDKVLPTAPCVAKYAPVFWEPLPGTGEKVVALVAIEPHETTEHSVAAGTYVVIRSDRLRSLLGRQRGASAYGVLKEAASYMTARQRAGLPITELQTPFYGFNVGPVHVARALTVEQLLDAAVRSLTAFGSADEMIEESESDSVPRHTVRTSAFLIQLRRLFSADDASLTDRFDKRLVLPGDVPEVTVDYAFQRWFVQATSLPTSKRQSVNIQREAQSKLLELEIARRAMDGNAVLPVLLVNEDALARDLDGEAEHEARAMQSRLLQLARSCDTLMLEASSVEHGVQLVSGLHENRTSTLSRIA